MKLTRVQVCRSRSIFDASLDSLGEFKVLIGKNNPGKSNMLIAIESFFDALVEPGRSVSVPEYRSNRVRLPQQERPDGHKRHSNV